MTPAAGLRYRLAAKAYDVISLERFVYADGRRTGVDMLGLSAGDRVLDVGCGTGLSFPLLRDRVGIEGEVVGLDASPQMAAQARARARRQNWRNVRVEVADAASDIRWAGTFDAAIFTYSLSVIGQWRLAWEQAVAIVRPAGRVAVIDLGLPFGAGRWARPLARLACAAGGSDPRRAPWQLVVDQATAVRTTDRLAGHVRVAAGTLREQSA